MTKQALARKKPVLLLGSYGRRNIGDDIYLKILLEELWFAEIDFNCWQLDNLPVEVSDGTSRTMIPTRYFGGSALLRSFLRSPVVIYGGGELWMRLDGTKIRGASIYKMLLINTTAKLLGKRVYYLSVGSEPLDSHHQFAASLSAKLATRIYFRDKESAGYLGLSGPKYSVVPDMAYLLGSHPMFDTLIPKTNSKNKPKIPTSKIAISVSGYVASGSSAAKEHLEELAKFINQNFKNDKVILLSAMSDTQAPERDQIAVDLLEQKLEMSVEKYEYGSIVDFAKVLKSSNLVLSYRLHVGILAHLVGVPVIGIGYRPKVGKYFQNFSDPRAHCSVENLYEDLGKALASVGSFHKVQNAKTQKVVKSARVEYSKIFKTIKEDLYHGL